MNQQDLEDAEQTLAENRAYRIGKDWGTVTPALPDEGWTDLPTEPPSFDFFALTDAEKEEVFKNGGIQIASGEAAWPLAMEMHMDAVTIEDVAHALAMKVRYTGHCNEQYSIAQHSCHVCDLCPDEDKHEGLMHDAGEFVLPDFAAPVKRTPDVRAFFKPIEHQAEVAIAKRFNLRYPWPPSVKFHDNGIALFEREKIMAPPKHKWMVWQVPGDPAFIPDFEVWDWRRAKHEFLARAERLHIR